MCRTIQYVILFNVIYSVLSLIIRYIYNQNNYAFCANELQKDIKSQTVDFKTNQHVGFVSQKILMHLSSSLPVTWQQNAHIPCATRDTRSAALTNVSLTVPFCVFGFWVTISISATLFASEIKRWKEYYE